MAAATEYALLTKSDRPFKRICSRVSDALPEKYRGFPAIHKLITVILLREVVASSTGFRGTPIGGSEFENSFRSLYRPSLSQLPLPEGSGLRCSLS